MVVVVARLAKGDHTELLVAPVTHGRPGAEDGVELPPPVKRHLGLDQERSWIIATELNRFIWPGPDIRPTADGTPYYGEIPGKVFEQLRKAILRHKEGHRLRAPKRTE